MNYTEGSGMNARNELTYVVCVLIPLLLAAVVYTNLA